LPVQQVIRHDAAFALIRGKPTASWPGPQRLQPHALLNAMQAAALTQRQHVMPNAARAVGPVAAHEAGMNLTTKDFIIEAALAAGPPLHA